MLHLYPEMKDRDNEDEILEHFCFVLAVKGGREGALRRIKVLEPSEIVIQFFSQAYPSACLLVHTVKQNHKLQGEKGKSAAENYVVYCASMHQTLCKLPTPHKWTA